MVGVGAPLEPAVVWFTGLSGAGKSAIAQAVCERLLAAGAKVEYLDGDSIRSVFPQTGYSKAERDAHVKRVGFLASRLEHHGVFVVCALISPYAESREFLYAGCVGGSWKSTYRRRWTNANAGMSRDSTDAPAAARSRISPASTRRYEPPAAPELRIDTRDISVQEATNLVMRTLGLGERFRAPSPVALP